MYTTCLHYVINTHNIDIKILQKNQRSHIEREERTVWKDKPDGRKY